MTAIDFKTGPNIVPTDDDVLTTAKIAARRFHSHPGNKRFKAIIESKKEAYQESTTKLAKSNIIDFIVKSIHDEGGRFLCIDDSTGQWSILSHRRATDKISHSLRKPTAKDLAEKKKRTALTSDTKAKSSAVELFRLLASAPVCSEDTSHELANAPQVDASTGSGLLEEESLTNEHEGRFGLTKEEEFLSRPSTEDRFVVATNAPLPLILSHEMQQTPRIDSNDNGDTSQGVCGSGHFTPKSEGEGALSDVDDSISIVSSPFANVEHELDTALAHEVLELLSTP